MASRPTIDLDEDFVRELYVNELTDEEVQYALTVLEPHREVIEYRLRKFDPETQSWRDYRNSEFAEFDPIGDRMRTPTFTVDPELAEIEESCTVATGDYPGKYTREMSIQAAQEAAKAPAHPFDQDYFHGGRKVGGYAGEGYRDFPVHAITARHVLDRKPTSVLELGCARGYVLKRIQDAGVPAHGLEISEHCQLTRVVDGVVTWDITRTPWPETVVPYDLCVSVAVLEHIPEDKLPAVFAEMARCTQRGLHGVDVHDDDHFDQTHVTIRPIEWWRERMPPGHEVVDKEELERGELVQEGYAPGIKLNLGSFTTMFPGWRNLDRVDLGAWATLNGYSFTRVDLSEGLPFDDDIADLIYASHVIEHFTYAAGTQLLAECRRVLKPGGLLRVAVPDAERLIRNYQDGSIKRLDELSPTPARTPIDRLYALLCDGHHALYDWPRMHLALTDAGFSVVEHSSFRSSRSNAMRRETIDLYPDLSLFVEAVK